MSAHSEIIRFFQERFPEVGLTIDICRNPKQEVLNAAYKCLVSAIFGLPDNYFMQDENDPQACFMVLMKLIQSSTDDITLDDTHVFTISDLIMPDAKRTCYFLHSLIKFYKFIMTRMEDVDDVFNEMESIRSQLDEEQKKVAKLQDDIGKQISKNETAKRRRNELGSKHVELLDQLHKAQLKKDEVKKDAQMKESEIVQMESRLESLTRSYEDACLVAKQLASEVVTSPEKMNADIERTEKEVFQIEEAIADYKKQARESTRKLADAEEMYMKIGQFEEKKNQKIQEKQIVVQEEQNLKRKAEIILENKQQNLQQAERSYNAYESEQLEKIEAYESTRNNEKQNIEFRQNSLKSLKKEIEDLKQTQKTLAQEKNTRLNEIKAFEGKINEMEKQFNESKNFVQKLKMKAKNTYENGKQSIETGGILYDQLLQAARGRNVEELKRLLNENTELQNELRDLQNS